MWPFGVRCEGRRVGDGRGCWGETAKGDVAVVDLFVAGVGGGVERDALSQR